MSSLYRTTKKVIIEVEACAVETTDNIVTCEEEFAEFFSAYLRDKEGLAVCIADFDTKEEAITFVGRFEELKDDD